jgi:hypothetical protein
VTQERYLEDARAAVEPRVTGRRDSDIAGRTCVTASLWRDTGVVIADWFVEAHVGAVETSDVGNGIVVHRLYRSGPERNARRALLVTFPPGSIWPGADVHDPGPEDLFIVSGTFHGLAGEGSIHGPGTFLHLEPGTSHTPSTETGGELFVYYPFG